MKKITVFLVFLVATLSYSQNDDSYSKTLNKMFDLSKAKDSYDVSIKQMFELFKQKNPNLDAQIWNELEKEFTNGAVNDLVQLLVPVYKKHFTEQDLKDLIAFYESPIGKKFAEKTPLIMSESMQVGQKWGMEVGQKFAKKIKETQN